MNWYKTASLIDTVQTVACTGNSLVLLINGKRYEYVNIAGKYLYEEIGRWKKWKNKLAAGQKMSALLKNLEKNLVNKEVNNPKGQMRLF